MKGIFITATGIMLCALACITGIDATIVIMQFYGADTTIYMDSDGDGFLDVHEQTWGTSLTDKGDNPFTRWILPLLVANAILVIILCAGKYMNKTSMPDIHPALDAKIAAFQSAVKNGDAVAVKNLRVTIDEDILKIRQSAARERLKEPRVQELLMKYELICLDAMIDARVTKSSNIGAITPC